MEIDDCPFMDRFPRPGRDTAAEAFRDALQDLLMCGSERTGSRELGPEALQLWRQCMIFLRSDLPYGWPAVRWGGIVLPLGSAVLLLLALLAVAGLSALIWHRPALLLLAVLPILAVPWLGARNRMAIRRNQESLRKFGGDLNAWPLASVAEARSAAAAPTGLGLPDPIAEAWLRSRDTDWRRLRRDEAISLLEAYMSGETGPADVAARLVLVRADADLEKDIQLYFSGLPNVAGRGPPARGNGRLWPRGVRRSPRPPRGLTMDGACGERCGGRWRCGRQRRRCCWPCGGRARRRPEGRQAEVPLDPARQTHPPRPSP